MIEVGYDGKIYGRSKRVGGWAFNSEDRGGDLDPEGNEGRPTDGTRQELNMTPHESGKGTNVTSGGRRRWVSNG